MPRSVRSPLQETTNQAFDGASRLRLRLEVEAGASVLDALGEALARFDDLGAKVVMADLLSVLVEMQDRPSATADHDTSQLAMRIQVELDRKIQMNGRSTAAISSAPQTNAGCSRRWRHVSHAMHA